VDSEVPYMSFGKKMLVIKYMCLCVCVYIYIYFFYVIVIMMLKD
jgi:hypothetical protein